MCQRELLGTDAKRSSNDAAQVSLTDGQTFGKSAHAEIIEGARCDLGCSSTCDACCAIDAGIPRCKFRTTPQTGAKPGGFAGGGSRVESASLPSRCAGRAYWATVDAGRRHADEEDAIKAAIAGGKRLEAVIIVERHAGRLRDQ